MTDGYVSDVAYPPHFHREMTPAWLDAVTRGLGQPAPDFAAPFRWCELGCGAGLNALVSAATNPVGHFTAIDMDAGQIERLRHSAAAAGIGNLEAIQAGFEALADSPAERFAPFDVIVTHGVLSWIAPAQRQAVLRFIQRFLKPDGLVYAHYMTHPGLSAAAATQQLVRRHAAAQNGDSAQKVQASMALLSRLEQAGAGLFTAYPQERHRLKSTRRQDPAALAHEMLPAHWEPFHVADMIDAFAGAGCRYLGSATPPDNIDAVGLPAATRPLLTGVSDTATAETLRDIARNQSLRRDLYQRGGQPLAPARHMQALLSLALAALPGAPRGGGLTFDTAIGPVKGDEALFGPLLATLAKGPQTVEGLSRLHGSPLHPAMLNQAVQMLLWGQIAHPVSQRLPPPQTTWALNRLLAAGGSGWLATPALGTALPVTAEESGLALAVLEEPGITRDALVARFGKAAATWQEKTRPAWVALGILPAG